MQAVQNELGLLCAGLQVWTSPAIRSKISLIAGCVSPYARRARLAPFSAQSRLAHHASLPEKGLSSEVCQGPQAPVALTI
jgi:hypothetical protein